MKLNSLFLQSEMIFWRHGSEVSDHDDHIVIRTSRNPTWRWGNLLLFPAPPRVTDLARWSEVFESHFDPTEHRLFVWDSGKGDPGEAERFVEKGYRFTRLPLLSAPNLHLPERHDTRLTTRPLLSEEDWSAAIRQNLEVFGPTDPGYEIYNQRKFALYREMVVEGLGFWMGAWDGDTLAASCGVFHDDHITRYQEVVTSETYRNQGICTWLVFDAFEHSRSLGYPKLTLIAVDAGSQAERIYRRLGFTDCEMTSALRMSPEAKD